MTNRMDRRRFLARSAIYTGVAAGLAIVPRDVLGGPRRIAPSEKMNIAGIGIGGMGANNLRQLETENIVALCDVDPGYAEKTMPRVKGAHEQDWVRACKSGEPAGADFAYSGPLTETCLLGNVAKRVDARIEWDATNLKVTNLPEANKHVRPEYRKGWES